MRVGAFAAAAGADYQRTLRQITKLRRKASQQRKRMIGKTNPWHAADDEPKPEYEEDFEKRMPAQYRQMLNKVEKLPKGKKALKLYSKFWGIPFPTEIREFDIPGPKDKTIVLVGMGTTPEAFLADGPKGKAKKTWSKKGKRLPAVDADGKKIFLLTGRDSKAKRQELKRLGYVPETHYVPTGSMEKAGTFKKRTYWVHKHDDEGGSWPQAYEDQAGNIVYRGGTCKVGKWMRR
jgi:hypothetical protein